MNILNDKNVNACSILGVIVNILALLISVAVFAADTIDSLHLLKTSPQDERAVVKMEDGAMKIIKPGDALGKNGKVVEITSGRVVIEEQTDSGKETVIIRLEDGKQKIERISRVPDRQTQVLNTQ